ESYRRLGQMIEAYRAEHGIANYRDAAQRWDGQVFRPLWQRIRKERLTRYFPGDRSADFVARLGAWWAESSPDGASPPDWNEALDQFVATLASQREASTHHGGDGAATASPAPPH